MSRKYIASLALIVSLCAAAAGAQETAPSSSAPAANKGDQSITIIAGGFIPLFVLDNNGALISTPNMSPGATFGLQYRYMLGKHFGVGGTVAGSYVNTIGGGTLFLAPIGASAAWVTGSELLEFEGSAELGLNIMRLYGNGLISPYAKLGVGLGRYISTAWSIGANVNWWFVPELHFGSYSKLNAYANFLAFTLGAAYHF